MFKTKRLVMLLIPSRNSTFYVYLLIFLDLIAQSILRKVRTDLGMNSNSISASSTIISMNLSIVIFCQNQGGYSVCVLKMFPLLSCYVALNAQQTVYSHTASEAWFFHHRLSFLAYMNLPGFCRLL